MESDKKLESVQITTKIHAVKTLTVSSIPLLLSIITLLYTAGILKLNFNSSLGSNSLIELITATAGIVSYSVGTILINIRRETSFFKWLRHNFSQEEQQYYLKRVVYIPFIVNSLLLIIYSFISCIVIHDTVFRVTTIAFTFLIIMLDLAFFNEEE